jgi:hypothetical protein
VLHRIALPVVSEWYQHHPRIDLTTTTSSESSLTSGSLGMNPSRAPPTTSTIRYGTERWQAGERVQARDVPQQSGDQDFSLAYHIRIQDPLRRVVDPSGSVGWKPAIRGQWSGREDDRARRQRRRRCACYQSVTRHLPRRYPMFADLLCRTTRVLALQ